MHQTKKYFHCKRNDDVNRKKSTICVRKCDHHSFDKQLISKINKALPNSGKKIMNSVKIGRIDEQVFFHEGKQMASTYITNCSVFPIIREMKAKQQ